MALTPPAFVLAEYPVQGSTVEELWLRARRLGRALGGDRFDLSDLQLGAVDLIRAPDVEERIPPVWGARASVRLDYVPPPPPPVE